MKSIAQGIESLMLLHICRGEHFTTYVIAEALWCMLKLTCQFYFNQK